MAPPALGGCDAARIVGAVVPKAHPSGFRAEVAAGEAWVGGTNRKHPGLDQLLAAVYMAEHRLDWFHVTMRITVMTNMAKSVRPPPADPDLELTAEAATTLISEVRADRKRLKWFLWHGNVFRALNTVKGISIDLETLHPGAQPSKLGKAVRESGDYLRANAGHTPNYGERHRAGEAISTAFVESTVNQVISKRMVKNSRCAGHHTVPTCYSRSVPESSTTSSPAGTLDDQLVAAA